MPTHGTAQGQHSDDKKARLRALLEKQPPLNTTQIAQRLGLRTGYVRRWAKENGYNPPADSLRGS